jgi:CheY-like chemotaxis protein
MDENELACIHYPMTVVIIDDDESVLESIQLKIGKDIPCKTFSDPRKALDYLQHAIKKNDVLKNVIGIDESAHYHHLSPNLPINYNIETLYEHVYDKNRFSEVSVIIVDYAMPGMDGEKLCRKLSRQRNNPVKIILLTGEVDEPMAVRLFNAGIIDKFLRKASQGLEEGLKKCIIEMQDHYFQDLTYPLVRGLVSEKDSALGDPAFRRFFNKLCKDVAASSYYLIEISGSFLLMDDAGSPTFLIIKLISELATIADGLEDSVLSQKVIRSIRSGEYVPYFGALDEDFYAAQPIFEKHLYKAKKLVGEREYAYAIFEEIPLGFSLDRDKITSFRTYISNL